MDNPDADDRPPQIPKGLPLLGKRHVLAFLSFVGFVNVYALRVNLSVALVQMVNLTEPEKNTTTQCKAPYGNSSEKTQPGEFPWDETTQGIILGSFFYGYICTQIIGGWLAERFGGKKLFGFGVLCTSVLTLLTPIAARTHLGLFIAVRVIEGLGEGVTFPAMHAIWAKWAPPLERSKLITFTYSGSQLGTVISLPISGLLCQYGFDGGWPSVFYVFGACGCVWFVVWMILTHDSPSEHPQISTLEKVYIEKCLQAEHSSTSPKKHQNLPLARAFTSPALWAIIIAHFCYNWGFYTLLTNLPKYMQSILRYNIKEDGFLSAVPYICQFIVILAGGQLADYLRQNGTLSTSAVRKIFNTAGGILPAVFLITIGYVGCNHIASVTVVSIAVGCSGLSSAGLGVNHLDIGPRFAGCIFPAAFLIAVGYVGCSHVQAVTILTISVASGGLTMSGYSCNHLDIAPQYAGTLMGITNTAGTIPGIVGPYVVGLLTDKNDTIEQWQIVFYIAAGIYTFGGLFFLIFSSGTVQEWARDDYIGRDYQDYSKTERDPLINKSIDS